MPPIVRLIPLAAAIVLLAAGCGGGFEDEPDAEAPPPSPSTATSAATPAQTPAARQPHILVFTATGTAPITTLTYELDGKSTKVGARKLPWRQQVDVPADGVRHEWKVTMTHGSGRVEVRAIFNGTVVGTTQGRTSGTGTASASGSVLG